MVMQCFLKEQEEEDESNILSSELAGKTLAIFNDNIMKQ